MNALFIFFETLYPYFHRIRDFLVIIEKYFLSNNLRDEETSRLISQLVLVKESRRLWQQFLDALQEHIYAKLVFGRNRKDFRIWQEGVPLLYDVSQLVLITLIDFIDQEQHWDSHFLDLFEEVHILLWILDHISHIEQNISIRQGAFRESQHHLLHLVIGFQNTRSVGKHNLHIISIDDTHDTMTGCLSLEGSDTDTLPHQLVHQSALTYVWIAYDINKTSFVHNKRI